MEAIKWKVSCENTNFQVKNAHMGLNPLLLQVAILHI